MRLAHASLTGLTAAALALGLGFAACADGTDADEYPVVPSSSSSATGGAGPGVPTDPGGDDGDFPVDGGTLGPDGSGSLDGGDPGTPDGSGSLDGGVALDGDFTPLVDAI